MKLQANVILGVLGVAATFGAAVVGAREGGKIANDGAEKLQAEAARREYDTEIRATRTAARLFLIELSRIEKVIWVVRRDACYWRGEDYKLNFPTDDRRLLAANLSPSLYNQLARLLLHYRGLQATISNGFSWKRGKKSPDMAQATLVVTDIQSLRPPLAKYAKVAPGKKAHDPPRVDQWREAGERVPMAGVRKRSDCNEYDIRIPGTSVVGAH